MSGQKAEQIHVNWELECRATVAQNIELQKLLHKVCNENRALREQVYTLGRDRDAWHAEAQRLISGRQELININSELSQEIADLHRLMNYQSETETEWEDC